MVPVTVSSAGAGRFVTSAKRAITVSPALPARIAARMATAMKGSAAMEAAYAIMAGMAQRAMVAL